MVKPIVTSSNGRLVYWWNLSGNVGVMSTNVPADVQLVQFGYLCMLKNPKNATRLSPAERAAFAAVKVGVPCVGVESDPLVRAIRAHQAARGGAQDGCVSVVPDGQYTYDATHSYMLYGLIGSIRDVTRDIYPRFDKHPDCQKATWLIDAVRSACAVT